MNTKKVSDISRFGRTKRNFLWQLVYQIIVLILGLVLPRFVISVYGSEVNGLTSTIKRVITLVSLAQSGISTAVTFSLFKPVYERDNETIARILHSVRITFRRIGLITIITGLIASLALSFVESGSIPQIYIFTACFLMCAHTACVLFFISSYNVFFTATQDKYIISIGLLIAEGLTYLLEICVALLRLHYVLLYVCCLFGFIVQFIFLSKQFEKHYKEFAVTYEIQYEKKGVPIKGIGFATANEIAHSVVAASQTVIISAVCGFAPASVFGIYSMVVSSLSLISRVFLTSFSPSYGSVFAEGNIEKTNRVFGIAQFAFMSISTFLFTAATYLYLPFVKVYTSGVTDINYVNPLLSIEFVIYGLFYAFRIPYNVTVSVSGTFKKSGIQTSITAVICIILSIVLAHIDYSYVLFASILFYGVNTFYQHFMLRKEIAGFDNRYFWNHLIVSALSIGVMYMIYQLTSTVFTVTSFSSWILLAIMVVIVSFALVILFVLIFDRKQAKQTYVYFKNIYRNKYKSRA